MVVINILIINICADQTISAALQPAYCNNSEGKVMHWPAALLPFTYNHHHHYHYHKVQAGLRPAGPRGIVGWVDLSLRGHP